MTTQCISNGSIGMRTAIGVLQFTALFIGWVLISRLDSATQQNAATLVRHEAKLAVHDSILGGFSPEFAVKIRKYFPNEQGR
jgi:hypothetical protein